MEGEGNIAYWQTEGESRAAAMQQGYQGQYKPECIITEKVYNECAVIECPTVRFTNLEREPSNVVNCEVIDVRVTNEEIPQDNQVAFTIEWDMEIEYTTEEEEEVVTETRTFRFRKKIRLPGARPGMSVHTWPLVRCLNCRINSNDETFIECDVGLYIVVKVTALVQLEIAQARFCPQPPECVQVAPIGCPEWVEMAEKGEFWPPWPPQPDN